MFGWHIGHAAYLVMETKRHRGCGCCDPDPKRKTDCY